MVNNNINTMLVTCMDYTTYTTYKHLSRNNKYIMNKFSKYQLFIIFTDI